MKRRTFLGLTAAGGVLSAQDIVFALDTPGAPKGGKLPPSDWYERSIYLLHLDQHPKRDSPVGRDAEPGETARLLALSRPDVIQMHAEGAPGWTAYPSKVGFTPPGLVRDAQAVWQGIARREGYAFSIYYNLGRDVEIMKRRPEWNRHKADGTLHNRILCYHSGVAKGYLWPQIAEIISAYDPDALWFDGSCFTVTTCYCKACRARFKRETGLALPKSPQEPGWDAFKEMQRQIYREFVAETSRRIKAQSPRCRVCVNFAFSLRMPEEARGVDHLSGDEANEVETLSLHAHWYDGQNKPFDLMTTLFQRSDEKGQTPKPRLTGVE